MAALIPLASMPKLVCRLFGSRASRSQRAGYREVFRAPRSFRARRPRSRLLAIVLIAVCNVAGHARVPPLSCQRLLAKPEPWITARTDAFVLAARRAYDSDDAIDAYEKLLDRIAGELRRCQVAKNESFLKRYRPFVDYIELASLELKPDHELGLLVSDQQYFSETRQFVEIPAFLLTQTFLKSVSSYETLARAKSLLREFNSTRSATEQLIFFSYKSRHLGTPDNADSFLRLLIVVPGDPSKGQPEKWVQFGIADPGHRASVRNLSVVSVTPAAAGVFNVYFKDFYRTYRPDGTIAVAGRWELGEGSNNCISCHKSGVLPIFPVRDSVAPNEYAALAAVNERFKTYGSPRFGGYIEPAKLGPGLSSASPAERSERFGAGFDQTTTARAMVCSSCHNPERLGALNWPMDKTLIKSYVTGGQMPFGHKLRFAERNELHAKLVDEYFATDKTRPGILKSWLLRQPE